MGRYYRLSKKITDDMATAILNEINELENVQTARITEDNKFLFVDTKDQQYPEVISAAVWVANANFHLQVLKVDSNHKV